MPQDAAHHEGISDQSDELAATPTTIASEHVERESSQAEMRAYPSIYHALLSLAKTIYPD